MLGGLWTVHHAAGLGLYRGKQGTVSVPVSACSVLHCPNLLPHNREEPSWKNQNNISLPGCLASRCQIYTTSNMLLQRGLSSIGTDRQLASLQTEQFAQSHAYPSREEVDCEQPTDFMMLLMPMHVSHAFEPMLNSHVAMDRPVQTETPKQ